MQKIDNKSVSKIFGIYSAVLILAAMSVNAFLDISVFKLPRNINSTEMVKLASETECLLESRIEAIKFDHVDITGIKGLTRKRRNQNEPNAVQPVLASYKFQPLPPVPVEFQGELTDAKRAEIRSKITGLAKQYLGRPYIYAAKGPNAFDCSGYTSYVMRQFGILISPGSRYQGTQGRHVELNKAQVGDLLFFSAYGKGGVITHVGLIIENTEEGITVIHANGPRHGIMIENVTKSSYWKNKILFARDVISGEPKPIAEK